MDNTQRITLDIRDNQTYEQIYTKQYNKGFPIEFEITQNGDPFDLSDVVAIFEMKKPDKTIYIEYCDIKDNILSIQVNEQITAADGKGYFQVTLYDLNSYNYDTKTGDVIISSVTGVIKIDKSTVYNGDVESSDAINIISETLVQIEEIKIALEETRLLVKEAKILVDSVSDEVVSDIEPSQKIGDFWLKEY